MAQAAELDAFDKTLLNLLQKGIPLEERPFARIGEQMGLSEREVIERVARYKRDGLVRQIGAIFATRSLGYASSLVAMSVPEDRVEQAAAILNKHPGITHNYLRNHRFNLWFTLAVGPASRLGLSGTVERLHQECRAQSTRLLPALKVYKLGVELDMTGERSPAAFSEKSDHIDPQTPPAPLKPRQIASLRELQKDLPLVERPFEILATSAGISSAELLEDARRFLACGQMRRFAAVLYHRAVGFVANAMGVWRVPEGEDPDRLGAMMALFSAVSHCYRRPTYPDWPYALFTMVHGRSRDQCEQTLGAIARKTGLSEYQALYSIKEYKKTRLRYFTPEAEEWEARVLREAPAR